MYPLKFHREAEAEYLEALLYLETETPGLGERFEQAIQESLEKLAANPQHYSFTEQDFGSLS
jgi:plasmid stabilization system protein ParE